MAAIVNNFFLSLSVLLFIVLFFFFYLIRSQFNKLLPVVSITCYNQGHTIKPDFLQTQLLLSFSPTLRILLLNQQIISANKKKTSSDNQSLGCVTQFYPIQSRGWGLLMLSLESFKACNFDRRFDRRVFQILNFAVLIKK